MNEDEDVPLSDTLMRIRESIPSTQIAIPVVEDGCVVSTSVICIPVGYGFGEDFRGMKLTWCGVRIPLDWDEDAIEAAWDHATTRALMKLNEKADREAVRPSSTGTPR